MRLCRTLLAIVIALLLVGCGGDARLTPETRFDAAKADGQGLILVGVRISREPTGHSWLIGDYDLNPVYVLDIERMDQAGQLAKPFRRLEFCNGQRYFDGAYNTCDPRLQQYRLVSVPAGRYVLADFFYRAPRNRTTVVTNLVAPPGPARLGGFIISSIGDPVARPERSFEVHEGEVVYIGDLDFDASVAPADIMLSRHDAAAQRALAGYPGIRANPVFAPAFGFPRE